MTALWRRRRACSCGVEACSGTGDEGGLGDELVIGLRFKLSIAGNDGLVVVWFRGAVMVDGSEVEVSCPPNVRVEIDCALCIAICL